MEKKIQLFDDGKKSEGCIVNGLKEGLWTYYSVDSKKEKEIEFKKGIEDGVFRRWFKNGKLGIESVSINGKTCGTWIEYYENGQIKEEMIYENDVLIYAKNAWDERGKQTLVDGSGFKICKFGSLQLANYKQYFENGKFIREEKESRMEIKGFDFPSKD